MMAVSEGGLIPVDGMRRKSSRLRRAQVTNRNLRLQQIARGLGIPEDIQPAQYHPPPILITTQDESAVDVALQQNREAGMLEKTLSFKRKGRYSRKELTSTLESMIEQICRPQQAQVLVTRGADVQISKTRKSGVVNRLLGKARPEVQSDVLEKATSNGQPLTVAVLAPKAKVDKLNCALQLALDQRDKDSMDVLLYYGADPNLFKRQLWDFIQPPGGRDPEISFVRSLLSGKVKVYATSVTEALLPAVRSANLELVQLLLSQGVDASYLGAGALSWAVEHREVKVVAALCSSSRAKPPHQEQASSIFEHFAAQEEPMEKIDIDIAELLLCAGATGVQVQEIKVNAARVQDYDLLDLISAYESSSSNTAQSDQESLLVAIEDGSLPIFGQLMNARIDVRAIDNILAAIIQSQVLAHGIRITMLERTLATKRPNQTAMDGCLLDASSRDNLAIVKILVQNGATTRCQNGKALFDAISQDRLGLVQLLVEATIDLRVKLRAVKRAQTKPRPVRLLLMKLLVSANARGLEVDEALLHAVREVEVTADVDLPLIGFLAETGRADVNVSQGACFALAAERGRKDILQLLLRGHCEPGSVGVALLHAHALRDIDERHSIMLSLCGHTADGEALQEALLSSIDGSESSLRFLDLLLEGFKADVNSRGGEPMQRATKLRHLDTLSTLLSHQPCLPILDDALKDVAKDEDWTWRYESSQKILSAGVSQNALNKALLHAVAEPDVDERFVRLCLRYGAQTGFESARSLILAVDKKDLPLLRLLFESQESTEGIVARVLTHILGHFDSESAMRFLRSVLEKHKHDLAEVLGTLLPMTFHTDPQDLEKLTLFLDYNANVNVGHADIVDLAIRLRNVPALKALLSYARNATPYVRALSSHRENDFEVIQATFEQLAKRTDLRLDETIAERKDDLLVAAMRMNSIDIHTIQLLVDNGAQVHAFNDEPLVTAVSRVAPDALKILLGAAQDARICVKLLELATSIDAMYTLPQGRTCASIILEHHLDLPALARALTTAIGKFRVANQKLWFIEALIHKGACADLDQGKPLIEACEFPTTDLWQVLLKTTRSSTISTHAVRTLLEKQGTAHISDVSAILTIFAQKFGAKLELNDMEISNQPLLFWCLAQTASAPMFETLLSLGANPNQRYRYVINGAFGEELVSILIYALMSLRSKKELRRTVVDALLKSEVDVNCRVASSGLTPLHVAVAYAPVEFVSKLISHGAKCNIKDNHGYSPLRLASLKSTQEVVDKLCAAGANAKDGSLNEAARGFNADCIQTLVKYGHDPNFPSQAHQLRGPMNEVLDAADPNIEISAVSGTVRALVEGGLNLRYQHNGKSWLFIALDSPCATVATTAVLDGFMGPLANDDFNLYHFGNGWVASALSFVQHDRHAGGETNKVELLRILENYEIHETWYVENGQNQPPDYKNAPTTIHDKEQERLRLLESRARDNEERQHRQEDEKNAQEHRLRLQQSQHRMDLAQEKELHGQREAIAQDEAAARERREQSYHSLKRTEENRNVQHRRSIEDEETLRERQRRKEDQREEEQAEWRRITAERSRKQLRIEQAEDEAGVKRRLLEDRDAVEKRQYERDMKLLKQKERTAIEGQRMFESARKVQNQPFPGLTLESPNRIVEIEE